MDKEAVGELMRGLDVMAAKLGIGAQVLWGALLKQAPIDAVCGLIAIAALVCGWWAFFAKLVPFAQRAMDQGTDGEFPAVIGGFIAAIVLVVLSIAMFLSIDTIAAGFFNPEFWALDHILHALKKS